MERAAMIDWKLSAESAVQRLRAIKGMELDANDTIRTATRTISALRRQIKALKIEEARARQRKRDVRREHLPLALSAFTASWSRPFFEQMQRRLPREVRDIVYAYVWDDKTLKDTRITYHPKWNCSGGDIDCDTLVKTHHPGTVDSCPKHGQIPYFMRPGFVGDASALEIVEFWYKSISRVKPDIWELRTTDELDYVIRGDAFSVGLDTTTVVRKLTLRLTTDGFLRNKGKDTSESKRTVDALLQIKNKANFKLRLRLEQSYLQLNPWFTVFDIFRPMIEKFEEEGADVRLLLVYAQDLKPKLVFNMLPALKNPESNWREEAARHFDSDSRVREHHKHYRIENDADYDPRELKSRDYSEDDWESDDYLGYEETDSDRDEDGKSISPEPPWTPYEPPRYYGTMFREDQIEEGYELDSASEGDD